MPLGGVVGNNSKAAMSEIPEYIREQLNAQPPEDCCVQHDTLPEIGTGYFEQARVATVGINPHGGARRLSYPPMDEGGAEQAWDDKQRYFERRTYSYFTHLEPILQACGASYGGKYDPDRRYSSLAVSLDVVQWATDPQWGGLSEDAKNKLLVNGASFFTKVLEENPNIEVLLGNGKSAVEQMASSFKVHFRERKENDLRTRLYCGELLGRQFIGWSTFLSNSPLNRLERAELANRVGELYRTGC